MTTPDWLRPLSNLVLGRSDRHRRHVLFVLFTLQLYAVCLGVIWHSNHLGILRDDIARTLITTGVGMFALFYLLVRSGWTQSLNDPVLTLPHAALSITLCVLAYVLLGDTRANVLILIAQAIVASMFRLQPTHVLGLGLYTVAIFLSAVVGLSVYDVQRFPWQVGLTHFIVGGATLLTLSLIAKWVSDIRVRIGDQAKELSETLDTLRHMATQDMLTGLMNRRVMIDTLEEEIKLMQRHGHPLTIALIDLDFFKQVNDAYGHHAGDEVLKTFARISEVNLRSVDRMARWGGEEFLCLLPKVTAEEARSAIDRLRESFRAARIPGQPDIRVSFSAGIAQAQPGEGMDQWIERADRALYQAKHQGRSQCVINQESTTPTPMTTMTTLAGSPA